MAAVYSLGIKKTMVSSTPKWIALNLLIISLRSVKVPDYISDPHPLMNLFLHDKLKDKLVSMILRVDVIRELHRQSFRETARLLVSQSGDKQLRSMIELVRTCDK